MNSIDDDIIVELVAVISSGSKMVNKHGLRLTQKISLLLFIDSFINKNLEWRLSNISTGEGKSLITIATAIAQLLIKGGTIDIYWLALKFWQKEIQKKVKICSKHLIFL